MNCEQTFKNEIKNEIEIKEEEEEISKYTGNHYLETTPLCKKEIVDQDFPVKDQLKLLEDKVFEFSEIGCDFFNLQDMEVKEEPIQIFYEGPAEMPYMKGINDLAKTEPPLEVLDNADHIFQYCKTLREEKKFHCGPDCDTSLPILCIEDKTGKLETREGNPIPESFSTFSVSSNSNCPSVLTEKLVDVDLQANSEKAEMTDLKSPNRNGTNLKNTNMDMNNIRRSKYPLVKLERLSKNTISENIPGSPVKVKASIKTQKTSRQRTLKNIFSCSHCNYSSKNNGHVKRHTALHTKEKPFKCSICSFNTSSKSYLKEHKLIHCKKTLKCPNCDYTTSSKMRLKTHGIKHERKDGDCTNHISVKLLTCSKCDYNTYYTDRFRIHKLNHTGRFLYNCSECNYSSNDRKHFKRHVLIHSDIKLFKCSKCYYSTSYKYHLRRHEKRHKNSVHVIADALNTNIKS